MRPTHRRPMHPGVYLRTIVLPAVFLTQQEISERIEVSRNTISSILHERMRLSPEVAAKLGRLFGIDAGILLRMQVAYDLWEIEHDSTYLSWIKPIEKIREGIREGR